MTWADDYYAATNDVTVANLGVSWTYYIKKFLDTQRNAVVMSTLGQPTPLPRGEGKTVQWHRYCKLAASVSGSHLTESVNPDATTFTMQALTASMEEFGAFAKLSTMLSMTSLDKSGEGVADMFGKHAAEVMDLLLHQEVAANSGRILRADIDATKTFKGTVDAGSTSTTMVDAALTSNTNYGDANDDLNQSIVTMLTGTSAGQSRPVRR